MTKQEAAKALEATRALYLPLIEQRREDNARIRKDFGEDLDRRLPSVQRFYNGMIRANNKEIQHYTDKIKRAEANLKKAKQ